MEHLTDTRANSYQEAQIAMTSCAELVQRPKPDWHAIRSSLERFRGIERFGEVPEEKSTTMISLVWAVLGDCHRELGEILEAAEAYRVATRYQRRHPTGFAEYYGEIVLKHDLRDHYLDAIHSLQASHAAWQKLPLLIRLSGHFKSLIMCWRSGRLWHPMLGKRKKLIRSLCQKVQALGIQIDENNFA